MADSEVHVSNRRLRTPRAAAIAGILFAVLMVASLYITQITIPAESAASSDWLEEGAVTITFALGLLPFAGIAFLWFMGVIRDRIGLMEDQFFSTLFFGSGLLYLAMTFASAAIAGGILAVYAFNPEVLLTSGLYTFARSIIYKFNNIFALRMAGMHLIVLGTIWLRTEVMPRWVALLTYAVALVELIGIQFYPWMTLVFPVWVFFISAYILILNFRHQKEIAQEDGMTVRD
jgi:hypothetical protein